MTRLHLLLRNLRYFRAANLAVIAGMAVATAVLTGALMVGDSVRQSLRDLALARLDFVDHAMVAPRLVDQSLARRLADSSNFKQRFVEITPGISLRGSASIEGKSRAPGVQITALATGSHFAVAPAQALLNTALAQALESRGNAGVRFSLPAPDEVPREAALARRGRNETILSVGVDRSTIAPPGGFFDLFNLAGGQRVPRNAWINLKTLQDEMDRPNLANLFLVTAKPGHDTPADATALNAALRETATLADYGLEIQTSADRSQAVLASRSTYILPPVVDAAIKVAIEQKVPLRTVSVYLINNVVKEEGTKGEEEGTKARHEATKGEDQRSEKREAGSKGDKGSGFGVQGSANAPPSSPGDRQISIGNSSPVLHYAIAAGISDLDGQPLGPNEVAVNQWTADRMKLKVGDRLRLDYYQRQPNGDLLEVRSDRPGVGLVFTVAKILPMKGLGADPSLTPEYKGLTDADTIADWRPPAGVNINKKLVTKEDETYWSNHKAAPKLFVNIDTAKRLWGSAIGDFTSLRIPAEKSEAFVAELRGRIDPAALGLSFRPVKAQQVAAASGGTDFSGLFIGFSFFLLIASVLLVAMLFRLSIEQRARQLGLLSACGFAPKQLRNLALREGALLAIIGGFIGSLAGVGYTALIIHGLTTWWVDAIGTTALRLHVVPATLAGGLLASILVAMLAVAWATRRIARTSPARLLAGAISAAEPRGSRRSRVARWLAGVSGAGAVALFAAGALHKVAPEAGYLGGAALLLTAALISTSWLLNRRPVGCASTRLSSPKSAHRSDPGCAEAHPTESTQSGSSFIFHPSSFSLPSLALRNASRNRTRSILCIALIALASFVIVTVSSMQSAVPGNTFEKGSGAGGFVLMVQTDIPLLGDLNSLEGRKILMRLPSAMDPRWSKARFVMMRSWAGQDASCLNITRPDSPTILAIPPELQLDERFTFAQHAPAEPNRAPGQAPIPVIADHETAAYILKLGPGDTMPLIDSSGRSRTLKLAGTLAGSIFQSELLMNQGDFAALFPAQSGFTRVLVECAPQDLPDVRRLLSETLNDVKDEEKTDYSATIETTAERLHAYHQVANTYLSTFQVLGSLGLVLGTIGLAVVLIRNLIERRAELALLLALGFSPQRRNRLVLIENLSLLLAGLLIGTLCALAGVIPNAIVSSRRINGPALAAALAAVLLVGTVALLAAVRLSVRRISPAALRAE